MVRSCTMLLLLFLSACDSSNAGTGANGDGGPGGNGSGCGLAGIDPACGKACASDLDCGSSLYCGAQQTCTADCVIGGSTCGAGKVCASGGYCVAVTSGGGGDDGGQSCPRVDVTLSPVIPTVMLLLDQSGSMTAKDFPSAAGPLVTRWNAMTTALTDATSGVLPTLDNKVKFGATLYTGVKNVQCPMLATTSMTQLGNAGAISTLLQNNAPKSDTPTAESIDQTVSALQTMAPGPDPVGGSGPTVIVVATDGDPDSCAFPDSNGTQPPKDLAVTAAQNAHTAGYPIFMLAVNGQGDAPSAAHMQAMANAGAGLNPNGSQGNATYYPASSTQALVNAFKTIIKGVRNCQLKLSGMIDPSAAPGGQVSLNGTPLTYGDANGWTLLDTQTIELSGTACQTFKDTDNVMLSASFACGTIIQ